MTLDRSWVRRPLVSPAPFTKSIPGIWAETEVTILRTVPMVNATGGFDGSAEVTHAVVWAHVEAQTESGLHLDMIGGPIRRRYYTVIIPFDIDAVAQLVQGPPRKGDTLSFTDAAGVAVRTPVKSADLPEGIADHWELETERFE